MKKTHFIILFLLLGFNSHAQDVLVLKDGSKIEAKIVEITTTTIRYYKFSQLEGPIRIAEKYEVSEIIYQNGESEKFDVPVPATRPTQDRSETSLRPPKPVKDPVLQRGFFIEGLLGMSEISRTDLYYGYMYSDVNYALQTYTRRDNYFSISMRLGNKWYFGANEKWRPGVQASWLRFGIHVGNGAEDIILGPRSISIANIGMCNIIKFNDKLAMEANFLVGSSMIIDLDYGYLAQGIAYSIESKLRLKSFSLGLDYQYGNLNMSNTNNRDMYSHTLSLTVGRKF